MAVALRSRRAHRRDELREALVDFRVLFIRWWRARVAPVLHEAPVSSGRDVEPRRVVATSSISLLPKRERVLLHARPQCARSRSVLPLCAPQPSPAQRTPWAHWMQLAALAARAHAAWAALQLQLEALERGKWWPE